MPHAHTFRTGISLTRSMASTTELRRSVRRRRVEVVRFERIRLSRAIYETLPPKSGSGLRRIDVRQGLVWMRRATVSSFTQRTTWMS